jgi:hypothetical protein
MRFVFYPRFTCYKKIWVTAFLFFLAFPLTLQAQDDKPKDVNYYYKEAVNAYKSKDYAASLANFTKAVELVPNYPRMIYNIAVLQTLLDNKTAAMKTLNQLADMGLIFAVDKDESFNPLKDTAEFKALLTKFESNKTPLVKSVRAFTIDEKGLIAESIAYDPTTETFYLSSVHKRKIISLDRSGAVKTFADEQSGLWSVLGMKVDAKRRHLWVTSSAFSQMLNFKKDEEGFAGIFKFDLTTGKLIKKYILPNTPKHHALGDLVVNANGDVFATDSLTPTVYAVRSQQDELELFIESEQFASPQGLTFSDDEKHLFVADYARGIFDLDVKTKKVVYLTPPTNATLHGIDGLYFYKGSLIATQNGINPNRVIRISLSPDLKQFKSFAVIEANNPLFDEPSLGLINKDDFYFIANSQWGKISDDGKLAPAEKLQNPLILRVKLWP